MSEAQGVNVASLHAHGMVEHIVDERPDAAHEGRAFCQRLGQAIEYELAALGCGRGGPTPAAAAQKYRNLGGLVPLPL